MTACLPVSYQFYRKTYHIVFFYSFISVTFYLLLLLDDIMLYDLKALVSLFILQRFVYRYLFFFAFVFTSTSKHSKSLCKYEKNGYSISFLEESLSYIKNHNFIILLLYKEKIVFLSFCSECFL